MELNYPINLVGHDEWMRGEYALHLSEGDVITQDGEVLGRWRVVEYDPNDFDQGGRYEFIKDGEDGVMLSKDFAFLDIRGSRGFALSMLTKSIQEWHSTSPN